MDFITDNCQAIDVIKDFLNYQKLKTRENKPIWITTIKTTDYKRNFHF